MSSRWFDEIRTEVEYAGLPDPYRAFVQHRLGAKVRGIPFKFTFLEWWSVWEPHWAERGQGKHRKCMCRNGDQGAYEVGNVRIDTNGANSTEFWANHRSPDTPDEVRVELLNRRRANCYERAAQKWLDPRS